MTTAHKVILGIFALALVALGGSYALFTSYQALGAAPVNSYEAGVKWFGNGLYAGDEQQFAIDSDGNTTLDNAVFGGQTGTIAAGARVGYWQNDTGATVYVDDGLIGYTSGTASTSLRAYMFATTTDPATIAPRYDYTSFTEAINGGATFLANVLYATSTTATTTNSFMALKEGKGNGVIAVAANAYLVVLLQNASGVANAANPLCNGATCETATSSNRGVTTFFWKARYIR